MPGQSTQTHKIEIIMGEMGTLNQYINTLESGFKRVADQISVINTKMQEAMKGGAAGQALTTGGAVMPPGAQQAVAGGAQIQYTAASLEKLATVAKSLATEFDDIKRKQIDMISSLADATDAQKKMIMKDLEQSQARGREISNLRSMLPPSAPGGIIGTLAGMGTAAAAAGVVTSALTGAAGFALGTPLAIARAEAVRGGFLTRDITSTGEVSLASLIRGDPGMRNSSLYAGAGAIFSSIAKTMGMFAGGGALGGAAIGTVFGPGPGTLAGGGIGATVGTFAGLGKVVYDAITGNLMAQALGGVEEYLEKKKEKFGGVSIAIDRAKLFAAKTAFPLQLAYGGLAGGEEGILGRTSYARNVLGYEGADLANMSMQLGGMGGGGFGVSGGTFNRMGFLGRLTGLSLPALSQSLTGMAGIGRAGVTGISPESDLKKFEDIMAVAFEKGLKPNTRLLEEYLSLTSTMVRTFGGGIGAAGADTAARTIKTAWDVFGQTSVGLEAAGAFGEFARSKTGAGAGGLASIASWATAGGSMAQVQRLLKGRNIAPETMNALYSRMANLKFGEQDYLMNDLISMGIGAKEAGGIVRNQLAGSLATQFAGMPGLISPSAIEALQQGRRFTREEGVQFTGAVRSVYGLSEGAATALSSQMIQQLQALREGKVIDPMNQGDMGKLVHGKMSSRGGQLLTQEQMLNSIFISAGLPALDESQKQNWERMKDQAISLHNMTTEVLNITGHAPKAAGALKDLGDEIEHLGLRIDKVLGRSVSKEHSTPVLQGKASAKGTASKTNTHSSARSEMIGHNL